MADNSGRDSDLRNVLSLDVVYNPGGIDATNKTDTHLPPSLPRSSALSSHFLLERLRLFLLKLFFPTYWLRRGAFTRVFV